jgi:hypothetical protein
MSRGKLSIIGRTNTPPPFPMDYDEKVVALLSSLLPDAEEMAEVSRLGAVLAVERRRKEEAKAREDSERLTARLLSQGISAAAGHGLGKMRFTAAWEPFTSFSVGLINNSAEDGVFVRLPYNCLQLALALFKARCNDKYTVTLLGKLDGKLEHYDVAW